MIGNLVGAERCTEFDNAGPRLDPALTSTASTNKLVRTEEVDARCIDSKGRSVLLFFR
ncbi:hypothetical protein FHS20_003618 [Phyllobacterium endophyticum]|nr:hypothetical protein [Phyllobacterium endophyticum]